MTEPKNYTLNAEPGKYELTGFPAAVSVTTKLPDDHPIYKVVGRIASEWAHFEHLLDLVIWDLAGGDSAAMASVTSQLFGSYSRVKVITNLLSMRGGAEAAAIAKKLPSLNGNAGEVGEDRHRAVHDPWYLQSGSEQPAQFKSMPYKAPEFGIKEIAVEQQLKVIAEIQKLNRRAADLRAEVRALLSSGGTPLKPRPTGLSRTST